MRQNTCYIHSVHLSWAIIEVLGTSLRYLGESIFGIKCIQCSDDICCCVAVCLLDVPKKSKTQKNQKIKLCVHFSRASILHHCICLDMHDHGVQSGGWCSVFPGSICVSGFATPVVNCGTARVPMGLPM